MDETLKHLIHEILLYEWDPIGISHYPHAQDEYDDYIDGVLELLNSGALADDIVDYLARIETKTMGVKGIGVIERRRVAEKLLTIRGDYAPARDR